MQSNNQLEFLPRLSLFDDWLTIGHSFSPIAPRKGPSTCLTSSVDFIVREGFDPLDQSSTGAVTNANGSLGIALRNSALSLALSATGLSFQMGLDDPLGGTSSASARTAPSVKAILAKEFGNDSYLAASYDIKLKKPEFSACWVGTSDSEKATVTMALDPTYRALRVGAAVSLPGIEWRETVYNEDLDTIEEPRDDGARHSFWVTHESRLGHLLHRTQVGARLDLGRIINYACDKFDYNVFPRLPPMIWAIPGGRWLYNVIVPPEDEEQYRHQIHKWELGVSHDLNRRGPLVALSKSIGPLTASASWDVHSREAGAEVAMGRGGSLRLGVKAIKGASSSPFQGWERKPTLYLHVEPLSIV